MTKDELQKHWKTPPPGMEIVKGGLVQKGDYFYIESLGAWGPVPKSGWGSPILASTIARGKLDWRGVDTSRIGGKE